jgi:GNAT superfamily N-acetyltransferase
MADFRVDEIAIPESLDGPDTATFIASLRVGSAIEAIAYGTREVEYEPAEELPDYLDPAHPHRILVARIGSQVVGRAALRLSVEDPGGTAWLSTEVLPEHRGRGIGRALADRIEDLAREEGRTIGIVHIGVAEREGPRLPSPTGFGSVPAADPGVGFLERRGYRLEQIERVSRLSLPLDGLAGWVTEAERATGPDYAVRTWIGPTPERWRADLALLATRMRTDAPMAGLAEPEDVWTVDRLVAEETRRAATDPRRLLVAAAEHLPTGAIVAYSELSVPRQRERAVVQYNTLVLREHRGHRLGMLVKVANLAHLAEVSPGHPSVFTWNAEENRPMLSVNEAMGFVPIAVDAAWQRTL